MERRPSSDSCAWRLLCVLLTALLVSCSDKSDSEPSSVEGFLVPDDAIVSVSSAARIAPQTVITTVYTDESVTALNASIDAAVQAADKPIWALCRRQLAESESEWIFESTVGERALSILVGSREPGSETRSFITFKTSFHSPAVEGRCD